MPESSVKNYFYKEKLLLKAAGLSLTGSDSTAYKIYSWFLILSTNMGYTFLELGDIFKQDFTYVADYMLTYEIAAIITLLKTITIIWNRSKFINILNKLEREPFVPNADRGTDIEVKLIKQCTSIATGQTLAYWIVALSGYSTTVSYTIYKRASSDSYEDWEFAYGPLTILNVTYSPNYEICWWYQNISIFNIVIHFTTIDVLTAAVLVHITYQFKLVQNLLTIVFDTTLTGKVKEISIPNEITMWNYINSVMRKTVRYHLEVLKLVEDMEDLLNVLLLLTYLNTLGMICFAVFQASSMLRTSYSAFTVLRNKNRA